MRRRGVLRTFEAAAASAAAAVVAVLAPSCGAGSIVSEIVGAPLLEGVGGGVSSVSPDLALTGGGSFLVLSSFCRPASAPSVVCADSTSPSSSASASASALELSANSLGGDRRISSCCTFFVGLPYFATMLGSRLGGVHTRWSPPGVSLSARGGGGCGVSSSVAGTSSYGFSAASTIGACPAEATTGGVGGVRARVIPLSPPSPICVVEVLIVGVFIALAGRRGRAPPSAPAGIGTPYCGVIALRISLAVGRRLRFGLPPVEEVCPSSALLFIRGRRIPALVRKFCQFDGECVIGPWLCR